MDTYEFDGKMFTERITVLLVKKKTPLRKMYESLHIANNAMTKWRRNTVPAADTVMNIARYLGTTTSWLLTGELEGSVMLDAEEVQLLADWKDADNGTKANALLILHSNAEKARAARKKTSSA